MMSQPFYSWEACPPELLISILKYTNCYTLRNCIQVNKHWKDIAIYTGDKYGQWEELVDNNMTNSGVNLKQKTKLNWKEVYKNSMLWFDIRSAKINLHQTYNADCISKINVYRDNLIIISRNDVKYFDIETYKLIRSVQTICIDYDETDYIILEVKLQDNLNYKTLLLSGKSYPTKFECDAHASLIMTDVLHYMLESECCYTLDKRNVIWQHQWNHKCWKSNALSRYFVQPNTVRAFSVYSKDVYLLTRSGNVYKTDRRWMKLEKIYYMPLPQSADHNMLFKMDLPTIYKHYRLNGKAPLDLSVIKQCKVTSQRILVTAINHGDAVLTGFDDGLVKLSVYDQKVPMMRVSIKEFNVRQFQSSDDTTNIVSLNVYEAKGSHHVFVATSKCVFQVKLSYDSCK